MSLDLPALPRDAVYRLRPVFAASATLRPGFGGPRLPLARKGDHFAVDVSLGGLAPECAEALMVDLAQAKGEVAALALPIRADDPLLLVDPAVNGAGQAGSQLAMKGFPAAYPIRKGRRFSIIIGGRRYLHAVAISAVAGGDGLATVRFWPLLRAAPGDNDVIEFRAPRIEGFVETAVGSEINILPMETPDGFTLEERA